jgi:hypothetical protein
VVSDVQGRGERGGEVAEREELLGRLGVAGARFVALARATTAPGAPVPGSEWTAVEVLAHVTAAVDGYVRYLQGDPTPIADVSDMPGGSLRASNAALLLREAERHPARLAERLERSTADVIRLCSTRQLDERVSWHGRQERLRTVLGALLGEMLVHGRDVARARRAAWPIEAIDARLIVENLGDILPLLVNPATAGHLRASVELRLRGGSRPMVLVFEAGAARVEPGPAARADVHVSADPVAFLLVSFGRMKQWRPILTGRMVAWGRKPWLALRLTHYLVRP